MNVGSPSIFDDELDAEGVGPEKAGPSSPRGWFALAGLAGLGVGGLVLAALLIGPRVVPSRSPRPAAATRTALLVQLGCEVADGPMGVRVTSVERPGTPASVRGFEVDDLVHSLDGRLVRDVDDLVRRLDDVRGPVEIEVVDQRDGSRESFLIEPGPMGRPR